MLATNKLSFHQAAMLPDWGVTTLFTQGQYIPEGDIQKLLEKRGVILEHAAIINVVGDGNKLKHVELEDGRQLELCGLYVTPEPVIAAPFIEDLGLDRLASPIGSIIKVNELKESSVSGIYVAGDLSNPMQSGSLAIASGVVAGIAAHRSLMFGEYIDAF